jgi:hypothetical protein
MAKFEGRFGIPTNVFGSDWPFGLVSEADGVVPNTSVPLWIVLMPETVSVPPETAEELLGSFEAIAGLPGLALINPSSVTVTRSEWDASNDSLGLAATVVVSEFRLLTTPLVLVTVMLMPVNEPPAGEYGLLLVGSVATLKVWLLTTPELLSSSTRIVVSADA